MNRYVATVVTYLLILDKNYERNIFLELNTTSYDLKINHCLSYVTKKIQANANLQLQYISNIMLSIVCLTKLFILLLLECNLT